MALATYTVTYLRTHTATFVADNMRNLLRDLIHAVGLDPYDLLDDWSVIGRGVRTWLESGHLQKIIIEFYRLGSGSAVARWDFPINYDGSGVDDDMWVDKEHLRRTISKADRPPPGCKYRVVLINGPGRPDVPGFVATTLLLTEGLVSRATGTVIATRDIMASIEYWRSA